MSFRPGGLESDDDDFIDFGDYNPAPASAPGPLARDVSPSTPRVDGETEECSVGCEDGDGRQAGEAGDVRRGVGNGPR